MRAYSMDLRERVLLDSDAGMKAGEVAPRVQRHGRRCMLESHLHTLADLIAAHPDRTLAELKDAHAPCGRRQTSTFLAALRVTGLTAPGVFDGAIDGESFRAYIDQILVPTLQPGDIVMADNLGAHKVAGIRRAIQAAGATLWYLPPSSPDLKPIELCFAKLKALVRTARCRSSETLWPFLGTCLERFSSDEYRNYFRRCGYSTATRSRKAL